MAAKPKIKLHEPDPEFIKRLEEREKANAKKESEEPGKKFLEKVATSEEFKEQREVVKKIQNAKSGTDNKTKPISFGMEKVLSKNRKIGQTKEKYLMSEHERNLMSLQRRKLWVLEEIDRKKKDFKKK